MGSLTAVIFLFIVVSVLLEHFMQCFSVPVVGDVCFDKSSGFWLVHSVPHLPPWANESYAYPHTGRMYGQTFLCVTYNYDQLNLIGTSRQFSKNVPCVTTVFNVVCKISWCFCLEDVKSCHAHKLFPFSLGAFLLYWFTLFILIFI